MMLDWNWKEVKSVSHLIIKKHIIFLYGVLPRHCANVYSVLSIITFNTDVKLFGLAWFNKAQRGSIQGDSLKKYK